jgi:hypothetical protein
VTVDATRRNRTVVGIQTVRQDPERRPVRAHGDNGVVWRAAYDGDGVRRKRLDAKGTIHYLGDYERNVGNGIDTTETSRVLGASG